MRRTIRGRTVENRVASRQGINIHKDTSFDRGTGTTSATVTINRGRSLIARFQIQRTRNGAITATTTYGAEVKGPRTITQTSRDGKTFRRTIDGRPADAQRGFRKGGQGAPQVTIDPALRQSLHELAAEIRKSSKECRTEPEPEAPRPAQPKSKQAPAIRGRKGQFRSAQSGALRRAAFNWYVPAAHNSPACTRCHDRCSDDYASCAFDTDSIIDVIFSVATLPARVAVCLGVLGVCNGNCYRPGQGCCPVPCGGLTESCCGNGATCMLPAQRTCCPPGQRVCRGTCCEKGVVGCAPDGFCGCPQNETPCGDACCEKGQICCGGVCCAPGRCRNGLCTDVPDMAKCGGVTCGAFDNCCGGRCCTGTCINNQCCPPARGCGPACCAPGQTCIDGNKGICHSPTRRCRNFGPVRRVACRTQLPNGSFTEICCNRGRQCCAGKCCPRGHQCCRGSGGKELGCCSHGGVK